MSYRAAHDRVKRTRGKASEHVCGHCGREAKDWAYGKGDPEARLGVTNHGRSAYYSDDPGRYIPLCRHCHALFDGASPLPCPCHDLRGNVLPIPAGGHGDYRSPYSDGVIRAKLC